MTTHDTPKPGSDEAVALGADRGWFRNPHQPRTWCYEGTFPAPPMPPEAQRDMDPQGEIARLTRELATLRERLATAERERDALRKAASDALAGWRYIRCQHGDLYGVGWDRVEGGLHRALDPSAPDAEREAG